MDSREKHAYRTIEAPSEAVFKDRGSKFMAFAFPVASEAEVKDHLAELRKRFYDARHHCYAYRINPKQPMERANDDGEPHHSAGTPILGQLISVGVVNTLVVVVRYFGGTKLGVPGLINAYKTSTRQALDAASLVEHEFMEELNFTFDYQMLNDVMRMVKQFDAKVIEQCMGQLITMRIALREDKLKIMRDQFIKMKKITFNHDNLKP